MPSIIEYVLKERGPWPVVPDQLSYAQRHMMPYGVMNVLDRIAAEEELDRVWEQPSPVPDWTYHDLLAHLATGDWVCQGVLRTVLDGRRLDEFVAGLDLDGTNARLVAERRDAGLSSLAYEYVTMRWETFNLMSQLTPQMLNQTVIDWGHRRKERPDRGTQTLQEYLDGFWHHEAAHLEQLETALSFRERDR